ncbi:MAG: hypothetical protein ACYDBB_11515 [Armatimonadota bacterium]
MHSLYISLFLLLCLAPTFAAVTLTQSAERYLLENDLLRIGVNPTKGGMVDEYLVKATGKQLIGEGCNMLADHFWQQIWPGEFMSARYDARIAAASPDAATLEVSCVSHGWNGSNLQNGVKVIRRMTLRDGSPLLFVEIELQNTGEVGRVAGYWSQHILFANGDKSEKQLFYRPSVRGVSEATYESVGDKMTVGPGDSADGFIRDPQHGWMAVMGVQSRNGVAFVMKYDELMFIYNCMSYFTTEWQYRAAGIPAGKSWKTDFVVYPLTGLPRVDYAGRDFAAAVEPSDADGKLTVRLQLIASGAPVQQATVDGEMVLVRQPNRPVTPFAVRQVMTLTNSPITQTYQLPHDSTEPVALRFTVRGKIGDRLVEEKFETWYGAKYGKNWQVDGTPLYPLPCPQRHVTFLKPDKIEKTINKTPRALLCRGMYAYEYLPDTIFEKMGAELDNSYFKPTGIWPATLSSFPASYEDLMALDVIGVINVDAAALGDTGQEMLKDFVTHGGTLIYGGDMWAYANGNLQKGKLAELLPVTFSEEKKDLQLRYLKSSPVKVSVNGKPAGSLAKNVVMLYAANTFTAKSGAVVHLTCKGQPVLVSWKVGQGRVIAITGTALGDAPKGKALFTRSPAWSAFMADLLMKK